MLAARGPRPHQLDAPPPERIRRAEVVGSGPLDWRLAGATQTRCDVEAGTELGGTRRSGTELVRGGARGFLGPNSSPIPIVTRRCQTSHCGWLRDDDAPENRTLVPLCGADAIAGGRVNAVTIVDAALFPFAPSKRRRSCAGCVWVGKNPSLRRWASVGNWTKSMAKLDAQEIKQRANPQPGDNPASCRLLAGHYLLLAAGDGRDSERTWLSVSLLSSHPGIYF